MKKKLLTHWPAITAAVLLIAFIAWSFHSVLIHWQYIKQQFK